MKTLDDTIVVAEMAFVAGENQADQDFTAETAGYASARAAANTFRGYQWYLDGAANGASNGIGANTDAISTEYTGRGIIVGIVDEGFDTTNPDLAGRFDLGRSFDPRDGGVTGIMPDSSAAIHGTLVAGVLGASADNGFGIVGAAPDATLAGFYARFGFGGSSRAELADLLVRQTGVDVSNNSWGYTLAFSDNFRDPAWAAVADALHDGAANGRDGLGTVFVFAAGNDRQFAANTLAYDGDNTNSHNLTNSRYTITVAASTEDGHIAAFSTPGASILVTAPGDWMISTAVNNGDGNATNDFSFVSGTSFATPIVSGVVAMMLEANPNLGYRDVQEILALSSHKIDAGAAGWAANGATNWNGGGNLVSHDFGFGLVDAHAAVRLAETWTMSHTAQNESVIAVAGNVGANATLVDFHPQSYAMTVPAAYADFSVDWVEVDVTVLHDYIGDLRIHLVSPTGTDSLLMDRPAAGTNAHDDLNFTFATTHDWGESPVGTWTLVVEDAGTGGTGSMVSFAMRIYGDHQGGDDTYYYTDDFATLSGNRGTISDAAGNDTINAAAVTGNLVLDLHAGATSTIAGRAVTVSATTVIENAYGGDGDDRITGNDAGDHLFGGHGHDVITGGAGADTLDGGNGADVMAGGAGNDTYAVDNAGDVVIERPGEGNDTVVTGLSHALADNVENLSLTGQADLIGVGNALDNVIVSNTGVDTLVGGTGNDTYFVHNALDHVIEAAGGGNDIVYADVDFRLPENVETLILISAGSHDASLMLSASLMAAEPTPVGAALFDVVRIDGYGNDLNNEIVGNAAANLLNGGHGADAMVGGAGNDIYVVDSLGDTITEYQNEGIDTVFANVDYTLGVNVETLIMYGDDSLHAAGNAVPNTIFANNGGDVIDGGAGSDGIIGAAGNDVISGGEGYDWLYGMGGDDVISGGTDNDYLFGGAGNDIVMGGEGDDYQVGDDGADRLDGGNGNDGLYGGAGDDILYGDEGSDYLDGGDGADLLDAGNGGNILIGGAGDDRMIGGLDNDGMLGGDGNDVEEAGASNDWLEGNDGNDVISGGEGSDVLLGGNGDDILDGGDGDDGVVGGAGNDTLLGGGGNDWIGGGEGSDLLIGGTGDDVLSGEDGNDRLIGGDGRDLLVGGAGADAFVFNAPSEGGDFVWDFERGVDSIEISRAGFGLPASGADLAFAQGSGLPADFSTDGPVAYIDEDTATLWFDANGGSSADATMIAGFISGIPGASDLHLL